MHEAPCPRGQEDEPCGDDDDEREARDEVDGDVEAPVLLLIIALLVLMGCFMEGTAILLITVPIFVPLAKSFGYDIVQLGIVMCISLAIGVLTPPVGLNLYVMSSITGEHVLAIAKEAVGYVLIMIIVAILVAFIPELSLGFAKWVP